MGKGDNFERECCRYLSLWWSDGEKDDIFWRNRRRITSRTKAAERQMGDIAAVHPEGIPLTELFNIEIKTGYAKTKHGKKFKISNWDILDLIDSTKPKGRKVFWDFWEQTKTDAELSQRIPLLIFSRDYHVPVVGIYGRDLNKLAYFVGTPFFNQIIIFFKTELPIKLIRLEDFLIWASPGAVKLLHTEFSRDKSLDPKS